MIAMVDKSKKIPTKPDVSEQQASWNVAEVFSAHCNLTDRCVQNCTHIQNEINSDEGSIFGNKKYKELLKLA